MKILLLFKLSFFIFILQNIYCIQPLLAKQPVASENDVSRILEEDPPRADDRTRVSQLGIEEIFRLLNILPPEEADRIKYRFQLEDMPFGKLQKELFINKKRLLNQCGLTSEEYDGESLLEDIPILSLIPNWQVGNLHKDSGTESEQWVDNVGGSIVLKLYQASRRTVAAIEGKPHLSSSDHLEMNSAAQKLLNAKIAKMPGCRNALIKEAMAIRENRYRVFGRPLEKLTSYVSGSCDKAASEIGSMSNEIEKISGDKGRSNVSPQASGAR